MTSTPAQVGDELFAELRATWTEPQIVELASALAWENYRARSNRVFDVQSEDFSQGAFCPMPVPGAAGQPSPSSPGPPRASGSSQDG